MSFTPNPNADINGASLVDYIDGMTIFEIQQKFPVGVCQGYYDPEAGTIKMKSCSPGTKMVFLSMSMTATDKSVSDAPLISQRKRSKSSRTTSLLNPKIPTVTEV